MNSSGRLKVILSSLMGLSFSPVRFSYSLMFVSLFGFVAFSSDWGHAALAQEPTQTDFGEIINECPTSASMTPETSAKVDELLGKIDKMSGTQDMMTAHLSLMDALPEALNFCDIERRLRRMSAETRLVAVPLSHLGVDLRQHTLVYPYKRFPTWGVIPRFTLWYEREGADAAKAILDSYGLTPAANLRNLNSTGVATLVKGVHPKYDPAPEAVVPGGVNDYIFQALGEYVTNGNLSDDYNVALFYAMNEYTPDGQMFSVNSLPAKNALSVYVIQSDPKRLLAGTRCNCGRLPNTNLILCDSAILNSLVDWVRYDDSDNKDSFITMLNGSIGDFLLHWVIGHEVGHFVNNDQFSSGFFEPTFITGSSPVPDKSAELRADRYAIEHMPRYLNGIAYMGLNFTIQQLYNRAKSAPMNKSSDIVLLKSPKSGHPNLLFRLYNIKNVTQSVDSMLEDLEKGLRESDSGIDFPSTCVLSKE